ncbi:MAG: hypothetical protein WCE25_11245 [Nitrososphaeraceae archaeon]
MKYLTFLDYSTFEATGKNIEAKLEEKDKEMELLKDHYESEMTEMRNHMNKQIEQIMSMIRQNPQLAQIKPKALIRKKA